MELRGITTHLMGGGTLSAVACERSGHRTIDLMEKGELTCMATHSSLIEALACINEQATSETATTLAFECSKRHHTDATMHTATLVRADRWLGAGGRSQVRVVRALAEGGIVVVYFECGERAVMTGRGDTFLSAFVDGFIPEVATADAS